MNDFIDIMTTKMSERDGDAQLQKAFILFSQEKDHITFEDLEMIAQELGENMTSDELQQMIDEAEAGKSDPTGVVQLDDFMSILKDQQWRQVKITEPPNTKVKNKLFLSLMFSKY